MKKTFQKSFLQAGFGLAFLLPHPLQAQQAYPSAQKAAQALVQAVKAPDMSSALQAVLGPDSSDLWQSGDAVQDKVLKDRFLARAAEGYQVAPADATHQVLLLGKNDWAFPIPLVKKEGKWVYDLKVGREEILNRRVGANELEAIQNMKEYVRAQKEYAHLNGGAYAQKFWSDPGKKNGLYWESKDGKDPSPIGSKVLQARAEGYADAEKGAPLLYHGYYYRMLKAPKGFALLAYPAKWDDSGVMSFVVNQEGVVFQKNLGKDSLALASALSSYKIDSTWSAVK